MYDFQINAGNFVPLLMFFAILKIAKFRQITLLQVERVFRVMNFTRHNETACRLL
jgi:hypothetical protein